MDLKGLKKREREGKEWRMLISLSICLYSHFHVPARRWREEEDEEKNLFCHKLNCKRRKVIWRLDEANVSRELPSLFANRLPLFW